MKSLPITSTASSPTSSTGCHCETSEISDRHDPDDAEQHALADHERAAARAPEQPRGALRQGHGFLGAESRQVLGRARCAHQRERPTDDDQPQDDGEPDDHMLKVAPKGSERQPGTHPMRGRREVSISQEDGKITALRFPVSRNMWP